MKELKKEELSALNGGASNIFFETIWLILKRCVYYRG